MLNKRILIVTPYFPYPINSGGAQAQFHMIDALRHKLNISIAYISHSLQAEANLQAKWSNVTFYPYSTRKPSWLFKRCRSLLKALHQWPDRNKHLTNPLLSLSFEESIDYGFVDFLQDIIHQKNIQILQFEFAEYLFLGYALRDVKTVFVQHEIHFIRNQRFIKDIQSLKAHDYYQLNMLKQQEIAAMNTCDAIITLTETDKNILEKLVTKPIYISPAIIPSPHESLSTDYHFDGRIVFLGGDGHKPNYEGFMWFLDTIWEKVLQYNPALKMQAIGKWRTKHKRKIHNKYKNIEMMGYVKDIEPILKNAIMVVPILTGSGMRMKIIDAANHGTPFITTSVGVEGIAFTKNVDCFIEDEVESFTHKTIELATNEITRQLFRENAFKRIKEIYPTEKLINQRVQVYKELYSS